MSPRAATAPVVDADDLTPARTSLEQIEALSPGFHELQVRLLRPTPNAANAVFLRDGLVDGLPIQWHPKPTTKKAAKKR